MQIQNSDKIQLTPIDECVEMRSDSCPDDTAGMLKYGLRCCCLDSEYHLSIRLAELREIALRLAKEVWAQGGTVSHDDLKIIDIQMPVTEMKRIYKGG